jgi:hypothetical protein
MKRTNVNLVSLSGHCRREGQDTKVISFVTKSFKNSFSCKSQQNLIFLFFIFMNCEKHSISTHVVHRVHLE